MFVVHGFLIPYIDHAEHGGAALARLVVGADRGQQVGGRERGRRGGGGQGVAQGVIQARLHAPPRLAAGAAGEVRAGGVHVVGVERQLRVFVERGESRLMDTAGIVGSHGRYSVPLAPLSGGFWAR